MEENFSVDDTDLAFALQWDDAPIEQVHRVLLRNVYPVAYRLALDILGSADRAGAAVLQGLLHAARSRGDYSGQSDPKTWVLGFVEAEVIAAGRKWGLKRGAAHRQFASPDRFEKGAPPLEGDRLAELCERLAALDAKRPHVRSGRSGELLWIAGLAVVVMLALVWFNRSSEAGTGVSLFRNQPPTPTAGSGERRSMVEVEAAGLILQSRDLEGNSYLPVVPVQTVGAGVTGPPASSFTPMIAPEFSFFRPQPYDEFPTQQVFLIEDGKVVDTAAQFEINYSISTREFSSQTGVYTPIPENIPEDAVFIGQRNRGFRIVSVLYDLPLHPYQDVILTIHLATGVSGPALLPEDFLERRTGASAPISKIDLGAAGIPGELAIGGWVFFEADAVGIPTDKAWVVVEGQMRWLATPDRMILRWEQGGMLFELAVKPVEGEIPEGVTWLALYDLLSVANEMVEKMLP